MQGKDHLSVKLCLFLFIFYNSGLLFAGTLEPSAAPAPTMKTLTQVEPRTDVQTLSGDTESLYVINQPGSYYLTGNITGVATKHGIKIACDNVTVDLNGFALIGVTSSKSGISVTWNDYRRNIAIQNGTVKDWGESGIHANYAKSCRLEDLHATGNTQHGLVVGPGSVITHCTATNNTLYGIQANSSSEHPGATISYCASGNNGQDGFYASGRCTIIGCTSSYNGRYGYFMEYNAQVIESCTAVSNTDDGIHATGIQSVVRNCNSSYNGIDGIEVGQNAFVTGNNCIENGQIDIGAGILCTGGRGRIEANQCNSNDRGIKITGNNTIMIKNTARGNTTDYDLVAGTSYGQIVDMAGGGQISATTSPWANFKNF